jgi:hypothetical protein
MLRGVTTYAAWCEPHYAACCAPHMLCVVSHTMLHAVTTYAVCCVSHTMLHGVLLTMCLHQAGMMSWFSHSVMLTWSNTLASTGRIGCRSVPGGMN